MRVVRRGVTFTETRLILGEGPHDAAFFRELIRERGLPPSNVLCVRDHSQKEGRDGFGDVLEVIRRLPGFDRLTDIIIATDSDDDPAGSFKLVADLVANVPAPDPVETPHTYPVPAHPHVKAVGAPSITVLMTPWHNRSGALETLCFEAAGRGQAQAVACVDNFVACAGIQGWQAQKQAKMRLRALLASTYEKGPDIGLGNIWRDEPDLVPVADPAFDGIDAFLRNL